jgi:hypothetical protein
MSKATRQKTKRCQHREVPTGETPGEALSRAEGGEAMLPQRDVTDAGQSLLARALETQNMHSACAELCHLNLSNRRVRTRMPGGVGGGVSDNRSPPIPI